MHNQKQIRDSIKPKESNVNGNNPSNNSDLLPFPFLSNRLRNVASGPVIQKVKDSTIGGRRSSLTLRRCAEAPLEDHHNFY